MNAAGVWADDVRALDEGTHPRSIRPAKGIHITVPWTKVRNDIAVVIPVPKDRRSLFVVPWGDFTYVGTTDTDYDGPLDDPQCTADDIAYVLRALNHSITTGVTEADIVGTWAGLRPLVKPGRRAAPPTCPAVTASRASPSRVVTVTGGKLTTYRRMAADTVDDVMALLDRQGRSRTKPLALLGAEGYVEPADGADAAAHLAGRYGGEAPTRRGAVRRRPGARPARSCPASPTSPPRPSTPPATRWPARSTTCCRAAPAPACSPATPPWRPRPPSPACSAPNWAGTTPSASARPAPTPTTSTHERDAAGLGTALDASLGA